MRDDASNMRICRIASVPTATSPGTGLPGYYLCRAFAAPTLFLTRKVDGALPFADHVDLRMIPYPSPAFGEKPDLLTALVKAAGLMKFFLRSIGPMTRFRPDIVHIHSPLYLIHATWAKIFLRAKICMTFHGSDLLRIKKNGLLKNILPLVMDLFFYVSESMRPDIAAFVPEERTVYTPNGVDTGTFRNLGFERKKQIVAVGNLRWQKGYDYLIDAFAILKRADYRLVIVGEGPMRERLQRRIDVLGLSGRIELAGRKDHDAIIDILGHSEIYVMSSVSEGFPKALLEGMASGLPVVTTDAGCCREISKGAGICVPSADSEALAAALEKLTADPRLRRRLASVAAGKASLYGWEVSCDAVRAGYESLSGKTLLHCDHWLAPTARVPQVSENTRDGGFPDRDALLTEQVL